MVTGRSVCGNAHSCGKFLVASGSPYGLAVQLNCRMSSQREDTLHSPSPKRHRCNSGYGSEICLQIISLQFVWSDLTDEGLLKVELLTCLLICIFTEGLIMHQYTGTI